MRFILLCSLFITLFSAFPFWAEPDSVKKEQKQVANKIDFSTLGKIPVQNEGRVKPLDSLIRETIWIITGRSKWELYDYKTGKLIQKYTPTTLFLDVEFGKLDWDKELLIACSYEPLLEKLKLPKHRLHCSYREIKNNLWFRDTVYKVLHREKPEVNIDKPVRTKLESEAIELYRRFNWLQTLGEGTLGTFIPDNEKQKPWLSLKHNLPYSQEIQIKLRATYERIGESWVAKNPETFKKNVTEFSDLLKALQPSFYPSEEMILKEFKYNTFSPFQKALFFYLLAVLFYALSFKFNKVKWVAHLTLIAGFGIHTWGIAQRVLISGRAPVSNIYESMIFFGWSAIAFGLIFELVYRKGMCGFAAAICGATVQIITDNVSLNPNLPVLEPVLKSVYLTYHVLLMMVSYAAYGVSLVFAHLFLFIKMFRPEKKELLKDLDTYNYRIIQLGCVGIIFGIFLGAVWANESWGRYWAWDPKETWALITFLAYLAILHGRYTNWWGAFGSAVGSLLSFGVLLMTYYGVNFFLVGKHSYAGASADTPLPNAIIAYIIVEVVLLGIAWGTHLGQMKKKTEAINLNE